MFNRFGISALVLGSVLALAAPILGSARDRDDWAGENDRQYSYSYANPAFSYRSQSYGYRAPAYSNGWRSYEYERGRTTDRDRNQHRKLTENGRGSDRQHADWNGGRR